MISSDFASNPMVAPFHDYDLFSKPLP